jgi:hypothetical protein
MPKSNPYDPKYVMQRDNCSLEEALSYINDLKSKNAWNRGKKVQKSNPYDPVYVMERDQCSFDEALRKIDEFKRSKATTLQNFIKKYGEAVGTKKYEEWKSKSLQKGWDAVKINKNSQSKFSPSYYIRQGYSPEESARLALEFQHKNSPLHIEYYIERGYDIIHARKKIRSYHDKKLGKDSYKEHLIKKGFSKSEADDIVKKNRGHFTRENLGDDEFKKRSMKIRKSLEDVKIWIPLSDLSDYEIYHKQVWNYTNQNELSTLKHYEKRGRAGQPGAYHLDHKFSISRGYIEGVDPKLIGSIRNLEFIPWEENMKKQGKCSLSIEELKDENQENK